MTERCPLCLTASGVVLPGLTEDLEIASHSSHLSIVRALEQDSLLFLTTPRTPSPGKEPPVIEPSELTPVGTLVRILRYAAAPGGGSRLQVRGICRARLTDTTRLEDGSADCEVVAIRQRLTVDSPAAQVMLRRLIAALREYCSLLPHPPAAELLGAAEAFRDPGELADFIIANTAYLAPVKQKMLSLTDPAERVEEAIVWMEGELTRRRVDREMREKVSQRLNANQREYQLREQLRMIKSELGEEDEEDEEIVEYRERIEKASLPAEIEEKLLKELGKLAKTPYASAESTVIRQYLDVCLEVPWTKYDEETLDVSEAARILDEDHAGMERVKERILEYLAVRKRNPDLKNQILCLVGAPGTGKTSVSASVAKALGRRFVRVCLGGIRDEAEIRGHRKTYIGAMPGRIVTALRQAEVMNPVILLDELDKMSNDSHGDPSAAMLEVLDAEQNCRFRDHFLELPVDLSSCLFIATANNRSAIPAPLIDRMEFIELPPYLRSEKLDIALKHLLPKQMSRHGLGEEDLAVTEEAILTVIDEYTREGGVRNLERCLGAVCRKVAKRLVDGQASGLTTVDSGDVPTYLPEGRITEQPLSDTDEVGVVCGLAWTESGGSLLKVEACSMPGSGKISLTGSLGDVMKESAQLAVSYLRAHATELGIDPEFHKSRDLHIHLPEGAVPKDGPSAGVTLTTALLSELSGIPVKRDVAMTGEISLHGRVLPIGGLREKATAAYAAGIKTVLIPRDNESDLPLLPSSIREGMTFLPVSAVGQVFDVALRREGGRA